MPAVFESQAEPQDPDKPEECLPDEAFPDSAMANQYNAASIADTNLRGLGKAKRADSKTVLSTLTSERKAELWKFRSEDQERRLPQRMALQAEYLKQAAIGKEMLKATQPSRFMFVERLRPKNFRLTMKVFKIYALFQLTLGYLRVKRFFSKLFS